MASTTFISLAFDDRKQIQVYALTGSLNEFLVQQMQHNQYEHQSYTGKKWLDWMSRLPSDIPSDDVLPSTGIFPCLANIPCL